MGDFGELKSQICDYLSTLETFAGVRVVSAFPGPKREIPLLKPVAAVSVAAVELSPAGFGDFLGGEEPVFGDAAAVTVEFRLFAPDADFCSELFESLCAALLSGEFGFYSVASEAAVFDAASGAFLLRARARLDAVVTRQAQPERLFLDTELKRM